MNTVVSSKGQITLPRFVREALAGSELAGHDQLPELVGDLFVGLPDPPDGDGAGLALDRVEQPLDPRAGQAFRARLNAHSIPNSRLPATDTSGL